MDLTVYGLFLQCLTINQLDNKWQRYTLTKQVYTCIISGVGLKVCGYWRRL